jgi:hypothetical protein
MLSTSLTAPAGVRLQHHVGDHPRRVHVAVRAARYARGLAAAQAAPGLRYTLGKALLPHRLRGGKMKEKAKRRVRVANFWGKCNLRLRNTVSGGEASREEKNKRVVAYVSARVLRDVRWRSP